MKTRILSLLVCLTMLVTLFAACGEKEPAVTIDVDALATALSKVQYVDEMMQVAEDSVALRYGFTSGAVKVVVYGGSGATPEGVIVAEYADESAAKNAFPKFEEYLETQKTTFDSYNAEFRPLLDTPVLERIGQYIVYCVCDAQSAAQTVLDGYKK